ncbi:MAG: response regulator transcription factor [Oscillospiraceae bacterium]
MIYCVEDDAGIRELVLYALRAGGFEADGFEDAAPFWSALSRRRPALVLLDLMLPGEDGLSILKKLRAQDALRPIPVILLTARTAEYDKVIGLDLGADDYISKPFGVMELLSRIKAVLRRAAPPASDMKNLFHAGEITLDVDRRTVTAAGQEVSLTTKEFELLLVFMRNRGIVLTRDRLLDLVWNYGFEGETRTVDVHVGSLRQKLGPCGAQLETVRGVGYRMEGAQ